MFYGLLNAMTSLMFFIGAMLAVRQVKTGFTGYSLAIAISLFLATCNAWVFDKVVDTLAHYTGSYTETQQEWCGRAFLLLILLWAPTAACLGKLVTTAVLRLVV